MKLTTIAILLGITSCYAPQPINTIVDWQHEYIAMDTIPVNFYDNTFNCEDSIVAYEIIAPVNKSEIIIIDAEFNKQKLIDSLQTALDNANKKLEDVRILLDVQNMRE